MKKLKLKPAARDNRRYFLIESDSEEKIEKAIFDYIGILGFSKAAYLTVENKNGRIIGSCLRESLNDVLAALALAGLKVTKVSGSLKKLKE